jgi:putative endonuclease
MTYRDKEGQMNYVYILTNKSNEVLYIGVTNNLTRRLCEHQNEQIEGFTKRYHLHKLVFFEEFTDVNDAIACEKQLKRWTRAKKNALVESKNPNWDDWSEGFI